MWANDPEMAKKWEKKEKKMKREQRVKELIKKMVREELAEMQKTGFTEAKETVQDIHVDGVIAMFKKGLENEGRWRLADGVRAKKLAQAYRFLDRIDKTVFGKPGAKESGKMRQELDIKLFKELNKNYDTDSMKKINLAFQKHSKGY